MFEIASQLSTALADRYRIEGEIGAGGMATVYLAEDLKHAVAIVPIRQDPRRGDNMSFFLKVPLSHGVARYRSLELSESVRALALACLREVHPDRTEMELVELLLEASFVPLRPSEPRT